MSFNEVDQHREFVIRQEEELSPKIRAIESYDKISGRVTEKHEHVHQFEDIKKMSDEELEKEKKSHFNFFRKAERE